MEDYHAMLALSKLIEIKGQRLTRSQYRRALENITLECVKQVARTKLAAVLSASCMTVVGFVAGYGATLLYTYTLSWPCTADTNK